MEEEPAKNSVQVRQELPDLQPEATAEFKELGLKHQSEEQLLNNLLENEAWSVEQRLMIGAAFEFASQLHAKDKHKDMPYTYHLLRVANRITGYLHQPDPELVAAALLHDSVEDHPAEIINARNDMDQDTTKTESQIAQTPVDLQKQAIEGLSELFSPKVAELVKSVTNPPENEANKVSYEQKLENYAAKVKGAIQSPETCLIKFADWCDNGLGIVHGQELLGADKLAHFKRKYGNDVLEAFVDRFEQPDMQLRLDSEAQAYVRNQLGLGHQRLEVAA